MEEIIKIKENFKIIEKNINLISNLLININDKICKLYDLYYELLKSNKNDKLLINSLDNFNFQNNLFELQRKQLKKRFNIITNLIYKDYYNIYKIIYNYCKNLYIKDIHKITVEKYDYLDTKKNYNVEKINNLFKININLIIKLTDFVNDIEKKIDVYIKKKRTGIDIDNLIISLKHKQNIINFNIENYFHNINFLQNTHNKYINRLINNLKYLLNEIENDIHFDDESYEKNMINELSYYNENIKQLDNMIICDNEFNNKDIDNEIIKDKIEDQSQNQINEPKN